ncbi:MAG: hypothetical protein HY685_06485 [Chloroflexi bacterium]|nr:hypothetical protein [Chloroflexota bacterium]
MRRGVDSEGEREKGRLIQEGLQGSRLKGRPQEIHRAPFSFSVEEAVKGAVQGPPRYIRPLKQIEDLTDQALERLRLRWRQLAQELKERPEAFAEAWLAAARRERFSRINRLIDQHNRYYPIEADLPMDPRTGGYRLRCGGTWKKELLGAAWVLRELPADLGKAPKDWYP